MISHQHKCIFIHISKCAGSSVENAFGIYKNSPDALGALRGWDEEHKLYRQHATPQQLLDLKLITEQQWDNYYKFIIYRNSWSKLLSDYLWATRVHKIDDSFENFLQRSGAFDRILNDNSTPDYCGDHLHLQKDYFFINGNPITYDTVIDFDDIESGFQKVINDLQLPNDFFKRKDNETSYKNKHYSFFYSLQNKRLVEELYQQDIKHFNFEFKNATGWPLFLNDIFRQTP